MSLPEILDYRPMLLAVAVATAGVMPAFLTGGLAVQIRQELGFDEAALGLAVALFFIFSSISSAIFGVVVERLGSHRSMRLAAMGSAASLLGVAVFAHSWSLLVACLVLGGFANAVAHPATHLSLAQEILRTARGSRSASNRPNRPPYLPPPFWPVLRCPFLPSP